MADLLPAEFGMGLMSSAPRLSQSQQDRQAPPPAPWSPNGSPRPPATPATPLGNTPAASPRLVTPSASPRHSQGSTDGPATVFSAVLGGGAAAQASSQGSRNSTGRTKLRLSSSGSSGSLDGNARQKSAEASMTPEEKTWKESHRRQANQFRAKALRYMQTEEMVTSTGSSTRLDILKEVVTKQRKIKNGCLELPLNIAFFVIYATCARLHEDITNVWLLESAMRHKILAPLTHVNTIDDAWEWMKTDMSSTLFVQKDYYGEELPETDWGRVLLYNQVQGSVILEQSREDDEAWGLPYTGYFGVLPDHLVDIDAVNKGFISKEALKPKKTTSAYEPIVPGATRRLNQFGAMWMSQNIGLPSKTADDKVYEFMLYPTVRQNKTIDQIEYLQNRRWIDEKTHKLKITTLLLNAELGRPRLEQMTITMSFSRGGGIYNRVDLQALFLEPYAGGMMGLVSMGVDFLFCMMLMVNSVISVYKLWNAFIDSQLLAHLGSGLAPMECFIMTLGWINVGGFYLQESGSTKVAGALTALREVAVANPTQPLVNSTFNATLAALEVPELSVRLHAACSDLIPIMETGRVGIAWMTLVLIFRFFAAFRVQPRLAVVTNTLKAVTNDLAHFLVVFAPTFFAYAVSGNLLFGRRLEEFSTMYGSIGVCLRIAFENEFEWLFISEEHWAPAAFWCWSYLICVVLIMVNMVLAIVLDIYNEVRAGTDSADTIFLFFSRVAQRLRHGKKWIPDKDIACLYGDGVDETATVNAADIIEAIPQMTEAQRNMLVKSCGMEMSWQAKQDLVSSNYLKLGASIKLSLDEATEEIGNADEEFHGNIKPKTPSPSPNAQSSPASNGAMTPAMTPSPRSSLSTAATPGSVADPSQVVTSRRMVGVSRPFPGMPATPGGYAPLMCAPSESQPGVALDALEISDEPQWFRELQVGMQMSSELMEDVQHNLQHLLWQWHQYDISASQHVYGNSKARPSVSSLSDVKVAGGNAIL